MFVSQTSNCVSKDTAKVLCEWAYAYGEQKDSWN